MIFKLTKWTTLFLVLTSTDFLRADDPAARLDDWRAWREAIVSWDYDCFTVSASKPTDQIERTVGADGIYFRSRVTALEKGLEREWVRMVNSDYAAEIERLGESEWVVQRLHLNGDPAFEAFCEDLKGADYFRTKFLNPANVWERISESSELTASSADEKSVRFIVAAKAPAANPSNGDTSLKTLVYFETDGQKSPVRMDLDLKDNRTVTIEYTKTNDAIAGTLFDECRMWVPGRSEESSPPTSTTTITRMALNSSLDHATCYLAAYGLPEPSGISRQSGNLWWWVAGITVALAGFIFWKRAT